MKYVYTFEAEKRTGDILRRVVVAGNDLEAFTKWCVLTVVQEMSQADVYELRIRCRPLSEPPKVA